MLERLKHGSANQRRSSLVRDAIARLDLARNDPLSTTIAKTPSSPFQIIERIENHTQQISSRLDIEVVSNLPGDLPDILVDSIQVIRVIEWLLLNILAVTPLHRQVLISAESLFENVWFNISNGASLAYIEPTKVLFGSGTNGLPRAQSILIANGGELISFSLDSRMGHAIIKLPQA